MSIASKPPTGELATSPRHRTRAPRRSRAIRTIALTLVFMLSFATSIAAFGYARLQGNINRHNVEDLLGTDRPTSPPSSSNEEQEDLYAGETLNFLFLGSDSRDGENANVGGFSAVDGMRADTTLLVQIPADRKSLTVVSIPRDTLVDIPSCIRPNGTESAPQQQAMINSAFQTGSAGTSIAHGAACTIKTVEALTGIRIDDFVVVDFAGFIGLIDALGGVPLDILEPIDDIDAGLQLEQGCQILDGIDALGYARVRKTVGDGSDISRIGRQQELLIAVIQDVLSSRVLTDPIRLYQVADAATQTITTGKNIGSLPEIMGLAASMRYLDMNTAVFVTMPFDWAGARVVPNAIYSEKLWSSMRLNQNVDPRITGAGWEITERLAADEAAAEDGDGNETDSTSETGTPTPEVDDLQTDGPSAIIEPSEEAEETPACTRETAVH